MQKKCKIPFSFCGNGEAHKIRTLEFPLQDVTSAPRSKMTEYLNNRVKVAFLICPLYIFNFVILGKWERKHKNLYRTV